jgi:hypothetical protein
MSDMHWRYFTYLVRHKWFVFLAGRRTGVPPRRLLIHDWSKFLPFHLPSSRVDHRGTRFGAGIIG